MDYGWAQVLVGSGSVLFSACVLIWRASSLVSEMRHLRSSVDRLYGKMDAHDARLRVVENDVAILKGHRAPLGAAYVPDGR